MYRNRPKPIFPTIIMQEVLYKRFFSPSFLKIGYLLNPDFFPALPLIPSTKPR